MREWVKIILECIANIALEFFRVGTPLKQIFLKRNRPLEKILYAVLREEERREFIPPIYMRRTKYFGDTKNAYLAGDPNGIGSYIVVSEDCAARYAQFIDLVLCHEYGHFSDISENLMKHLARTAMDREHFADDFAAARCGRSRMIKFLFLAAEDKDNNINQLLVRINHQVEQFAKENGLSMPDLRAD